MNLNDRTFTAVSNSNSGEVNGNTLFYYRQQGEMIWAEYAGGEIKKGFLIGKFISENEIFFTYQHLNQKLENRLGQCTGRIEISVNGKLRIIENWQWLDGERQSGQSVIEEI